MTTTEMNGLERIAERLGESVLSPRIKSVKDLLNNIDDILHSEDSDVRAEAKLKISNEVADAITEALQLNRFGRAFFRGMRRK